MINVMTESNLVKRNIVIFGMGATGISVARYLSDIGADFSFADSRRAPANLSKVKGLYPSTNITVGEFTDEILLDIDLIVVSPGISLSEPVLQMAHEKGIEIIGDLALFLTAASAPVVAITGSNGKSTVTTLLGEMAKASGLKTGVGGNLGVPMLDLLDSDCQLYILELSSFQLELMSDSLGAVVCLLNISPDHMDRYQSLESYSAAKQNIYLGASVTVSNRQDSLTAPPHSDATRHITFGFDKPMDGHFGIDTISEIDYLYAGSDQLISTQDIAMKGRHNIVNALAALALGSAIKLQKTLMLQTLRVFKGLPHRCESIATIDDVLYIDDSKGTNVGATLAAIEGFGSQSKKNILLIAGGQGKGQRFDDLRDAAGRFLKCGVLYGEDAHQIEKALNSVVSIYRAKSLDSAVVVAKQTAVAGDIVLLSPACASFDLFSGFEERGQCFQHAVLSDNGKLLDTSNRGASC